MASAHTHIRKVEKIEYVVEKVVSLELSPEEAQTLTGVLNRIGGSPTSSGRMHTDAILDALSGVGVWPPGTRPPYKFKGTLTSLS